MLGLARCWRLCAPALGLALVLAGSAQTAEAAPARTKGRRFRSATPPTAPPPDGRKFMVGIDGTIVQASPIRAEVVRLDPRFVGRSVAMGGLGLFGRYRPISLIGFDLGAHSGSLRYRDPDDDDAGSVARDQVLIDAAVLLYLGRGEVAQFAVSSGLGGVYNRIGYAAADGREGRQTFGSAAFRLGAEAEFLVKRVAFVLSFRSYALLTDRDRVRGSGALVETSDVSRAPVPTFATQLLGSAGIAFRF